MPIYRRRRRAHEASMAFHSLLSERDRHARIARRFHSALAVRESRRLRQHHDPAKDAADAVNAASVMLNNFDIPKGLVREGSAEDFHLGYTQWSVIADMSHKVYYYWTMYDRRMRSVDLSKLDFAGKAISSFPLDKVRVEDIQDGSADFPR